MVRAVGLLLTGALVILLSAGLRSPKSPLTLAEPAAAEEAVTLGGAPLRDHVPLSAGSSRLAQKPLHTLTPADIRALRSEGRQTVLVFNDDSELVVTPYVANELPYDLNLRLTYER